jgi:hypothetical protein
MATKAEKGSKTASMKALPGGAMGYETAARKYVNEGLGKLGLKPNEKTALREKLIPIVSRQMGSDRSRTASRAKGIVNRETKTRLKKANQL